MFIQLNLLYIYIYLYKTSLRIYYDFPYSSYFLSIILINDPYLAPNQCCHKEFVENCAKILPFPLKTLCHMFKHDLLKRSERAGGIFTDQSPRCRGTKMLCFNDTMLCGSKKPSKLSLCFL